MAEFPMRRLCRVLLAAGDNLGCVAPNGCMHAGPTGSFVVVADARDSSSYSH